jgi:hypothetical protein
MVVVRLSALRTRTMQELKIKHLSYEIIKLLLKLSVTSLYHSTKRMSAKVSEQRYKYVQKKKGWTQLFLHASRLPVYITLPLKFFQMFSIPASTFPKNFRHILASQPNIFRPR